MRVPHDTDNSGIIIDFSNPLNLLLLCGSLILCFGLGTTAGEHWREIEYRNTKADLENTSKTVEQQQQKMISRWELVDEFCATYPTIEE